MIDSHSHLENTLCDIDVGEVSKIILAGTNLADSEKNIALAKENFRLFPTCGIHPQNTEDERSLPIDEQLKLLEELVKNNKTVVAIGECGLDLSPAEIEGEQERTLDQQIKLFEGQIKIAEKYNLPLIIHARKAVDEAIAVLKKYPNSKGVFHCYAGGKKRIAKILDLGPNWFFGLDGNITYEEGLVEVIKSIPQDRLVLETDSPYLTPLPYRGQKNCPKYIEFTYKKLAEIWKKSFEETEKIIDKNVNRLFKLV